MYLFYDFESRQDVVLNDGKESHLQIPNFCVVNHVCTNCIGNEDMKKKCKTCGTREHVFPEKPVENIMIYISSVQKKFKKGICMAHLGRSYDFQFLLEYIMNSKQST